MTDPARAAASSRPSLQVVAGGYQVQRKIGSGGMGAVYLAKQIGVRRPGSPKLRPGAPSDDAQLRRRFERKRPLAGGAPPRCRPIAGLGVDSDGQLYLAFEYVEGEDLSALLDREGALSFEDATGLDLQGGRSAGLRPCQGRGARDIKPENIRVRRDLAGLHVKVLGSASRGWWMR